MFGDGHPAIDFLLLLAVADDLCGIIIIAVFYPDPSKTKYETFALLDLCELSNVHVSQPHICAPNPLNHP